MRSTDRCGLTLVERMLTIGIVGILVCLVIPAVQSIREISRRETCSQNIRQIGLAVLNYESAYKKLPHGSGGPHNVGPGGHTADVDWKVKRVAIGRYGAIVSVLPQYESNPLYGIIQSRFTASNGETILPGQAPWDMAGGAYAPWRTQFPGFRCPSDPGRMNPDATWCDDGCARLNYATCYGDSVRGNDNSWHPASTRGAFQGRYQRRLSELTDGQSNTILLGEIASTSSQNLIQGRGKIRIQGGLTINAGEGIQIPQKCKILANGDRYIPSVQNQCRHSAGIRWHDGYLAHSGFNTVLPPNSPSCSVGDWGWGIYSSTSYHGSGAHVVMGDLGTRFIANSIDVGDPLTTAPAGNDGPGSDQPSPFGVWGAMGSKDAGDKFSAEEN